MAKSKKLSDQQKYAICRILVSTGSDRASISSFIDYVDSVVFASSSDKELEERQIDVARKIYDIGRCSRFLMDIFSQPFPAAGDEVSADARARNYVFPYEHNGASGCIDFHGLSRQLEAVSVASELALSGHPYGGHLQPRRHKNVAIEDFVMSLVFSFHSRIGRMPVITEKSSDWVVITHVLDAYGYFSTSRIDVVKRACKKRRELLGLAGRKK